MAQIYDQTLRVIPEELRDAFDEHLAPVAAAGLDLSYAHQSLRPPGLVGAPPPGRSRPWGTGHAPLAAAAPLDGPFALCSADDFYGRSAFAELIEATRGAGVEASQGRRARSGPDGTRTRWSPLSRRAAVCRADCAKSIPRTPSSGSPKA